MAALRADFTLPLRSFELELALEVEGTVALVGPSGAGKTSVLRAIAGLVRPPRGRIALGDDVWLDSACRLFRKPDERRVGLVFQEYALFPHLTVRQNVAMGREAAMAGRNPLADFFIYLAIFGKLAISVVRSAIARRSFA